MTPFDMDAARRCQRALDNAASARRRFLVAPPETVKMFGHPPVILDEAAAEHAAFLVAICKRRNAS